MLGEPTEGTIATVETHAERRAPRPEAQQSRHRRMGIRRRIFLHVSIGLIVSFGLLIFVGTRALDQATDLIFDARLGTAESLALILDRDLTHIAADIQAFGTELAKAEDGQALDRLVEDIQNHLATSDDFAFFDPVGIVVTDTAGHRLSATGAEFPIPASPPDLDEGDSYRVLSPAEEHSESFGTVATLVDGSAAAWVYARLVGRNSTRSFDPDEPLRTEPGSRPVDENADNATFELEVIDENGRVALGIGAEEMPGELSSHYESILERAPLGEPVVLRHDVASGALRDHVMGVVPLAEYGYTVILEQSIDAALELPRRLTRQLFFWSGAGLMIALVVAWFTTRAVVEPARALTAAAERMGEGDLETPIDVAARDEFGVLAEQFEAMRTQLRDAQDAVEEANRQLESRVEERTAQLGQVLRRVITAQEDERQRVARELHDETAQTLGALSIALGRAAGPDSYGNGSPQTQVKTAQEMVQRLIVETRRLIVDLRPMILDDLGLIPAIRWYAETRLSDIGVEITFEIDEPPDRLAPHVETALFRIVQEAINNVVKHSHARNVLIGLGAGDAVVRIEVADDGIGFDSQQRARTGEIDEHLGLAGMRERVTLLGGSIEIGSAPGRGTSVIVEIPLGEADL